jgi:hypothetical protein
LKKLQLGSRDAPRRWLTKQQAIRHLIHAAVRLIVAGEDPFATHLLIQSADKLLIDLAKHSATGKKLAHDWTTLMKPEYKDALLKVHRETFNFLKHADRDHDQTLHVGDIALSNVLQLGVCIYNFSGLSNEFTDHMRLGVAIARLVFPNSFVNDDQRSSHHQTINGLGEFTLREFLSAVRNQRRLGEFSKSRYGTTSGLAGCKRFAGSAVLKNQGRLGDQTYLDGRRRRLRARLLCRNVWQTAAARGIGKRSAALASTCAR